ncbi:MAG: ABC transporter substrate-binding protein, partial [Thermoanaerobaculia bacterium]
LLLAQGQRMAGNVDAALREAEAAAKVLGEEKKPGPAVGAILFAAETAWQARRIDDARRWVERGLETARAAERPEQRTRLLSMAATLANLRGEYQKAAAYQAEIERLAPREKTTEEEIPRGGRLIVAMANPVTATEPSVARTIEEWEVLANVFETLVTTDPQGNLAPSLAAQWTVGNDGRTVRLTLRRGVRFSDGAPLTAPAVKAFLERSIRLRQEEIPSVFTAIRGVREYLQGLRDGVAGIEAPTDEEVEIQLLEPLPIFPALLTDFAAAIGRVVPPQEGKAERLLGTGPFLAARYTPDRVALEPNQQYWKDSPPRLDAIEFRTSLAASSIAAGLRSGEIDLAQDLLPEDLEKILREPQFRQGFVETPKKNTYFVLFNSASSAGSNLGLRRALAGVVRTQDFVWGALGRFALPATGLIPPGILGHDPGRRQAHLPREKAVEMVRSAGLPLPIHLKASVHPILQDRYRALTSALFKAWHELGVDVSVVTSTMTEYLESWHENAGIDLQVGRWNADYDDPDNFTLTLFHSVNGGLRSYFSSQETDQILEEARRENRPAVREGLYRRFENLLLDSGALVPLFHDVDYRIASPNVRGLQLRSTPPYVNYAELGKVKAPASEAAPDRPVGGGILQVPIAGVVRSLDPSLASTVEQSEVLPQVFQTLTFAVEGTRIIPWLASEMQLENDGTRFRFRLRPGVRFHDGRRLTARDVRYSFERLLSNEQSDSRWMLSPIRGAKRLLDGSATDLEGFHIVSPAEFFIDLEKPVSFFPALISYTAMAIVPEGTRAVGASWRDNAVGTGPFRAVSFEPGRRLELERNPHYWREGYPRSEGLVLRFGVPPEEIKNEFLAGRFSLASDLLPADADAFRHDPRFASGYRESPHLQTYFVAFNRHHGPLQDIELRRSLARAVDVPGLVRRTLGRLAIPAHGLIPPGLLGYSAAGASPDSPSPNASSDSSVQATVSRETVELSAAVHPIFFGEFSAFARELSEAFREMGFVIRPANRTMAEYLALNRKAEVDLAVGRWGADYPDADTFVYGVLRSDAGAFGHYVGTLEIDQLAEQGRAETDPRVRHSIYRQIEDIVARDALLLPLFHDQVYGFARPEVEGFASVGQTSPAIFYESLWIRR